MVGRRQKTRSRKQDQPQAAEQEGLESPGPDLVPAPRTVSGQTPAAYDPLRRYLYEIGQYEILPREEQMELAVRFKEEHDQEAAYRLITSNLRLVVKIAMEFQHYWMKNLLDLIQEGNVGLMQALRKFDPWRGVKFSYYASFWIRAYILKFILDNWHLVRVGTTQAQRKLFYNLRKEKERLLAGGYEPEPKLLAERLEVSEKDVIEMDQRLDGWEVSLDAPVSADSEDSHLTLLASEDQPVDDRLAQSQVREMLAEKLAEFRKTLSGRELEILDRRVLTDQPLTLQEMGEEFGVSRERVRQIEERLKKKIGRYLEEEIPELSAEDFLDVIDVES